MDKLLEISDEIGISIYEGKCLCEALEKLMPLSTSEPKDYSYLFPIIKILSEKFNQLTAEQENLEKQIFGNILHDSIQIQN